MRFVGLHMRTIGGRSGIEVSFDRHTESFELANEKVIETPIQASLLVRLSQGRLAPYLRADPVVPAHGGTDDGPEDSGDSTTEFGWHAGGGLELLAGRHFGITGTTGTPSSTSAVTMMRRRVHRRAASGYEGSMWTLGATFYF